MDAKANPAFLRRLLDWVHSLVFLDEIDVQVRAGRIALPIPAGLAYLKRY
jgi:hypothetical protein